MQKKLDIKGMTGTVLRGGDAQALLSVRTRPSPM